MSGERLRALGDEKTKHGVSTESFEKLSLFRLAAIIVSTKNGTFDCWAGICEANSPEVGEAVAVVLILRSKKFPPC